MYLVLRDNPGQHNLCHRLKSQYIRASLKEIQNRGNVPDTHSLGSVKKLEYYLTLSSTFIEYLFLLG